MDTTWVLPLLTSWLQSTAFYIFLFGGLFLGLVAGLYFKKKRKFKKSVGVLADSGNGKVHLDFVKGGWFKKNRRFKDLWESGVEEEFITNDGGVIYGYTGPQDEHMIDGKPTILVTPSIDDPNILIVVDDIHLSEKSKALIYEIPPIEIREVALDEHRKGEQEHVNSNEKIVQWLLAAGFLVIMMISFVLVTQYGKYMADKGAEMYNVCSATLQNISAQCGTNLGDKFASAMTQILNAKTTLPGAGP